MNTPKLNADQIAILAKLCEQAAIEFPQPDPLDKVDRQDDPNWKPEPWEVKLKALVDSEPTLPPYEYSDTESSLKSWVDQFMNYF